MNCTFSGLYRLVLCKAFTILIGMNFSILLNIISHVTRSNHGQLTLVSIVISIPCTSDIVF